MSNKYFFASSRSAGVQRPRSRGLLEAFFPIARDPGGNIVGIVADGEGAGRALYFDLDDESDEGATPLEKTYVVAESFEEFIDGLNEYLAGRSKRKRPGPGPEIDRARD